MKKKNQKKHLKRIVLSGITIGIVISLISVLIFVGVNRKEVRLPDELMYQYVEAINGQNYNAMYQMLNEETKQRVTQEAFVDKNKRIYQGIGATDIHVEITEMLELDRKQILITYNTYMETLAGAISFENEAVFTKEEDREYGLKWYTQLIFPWLNGGDKVRVHTLEAERGDIYDRNGILLAGKGFATSVGIVPGKLESQESIGVVAKILNLSEESIQKKLSASYVKEDTFVPLKTIASDEEALQEELLQIKGIMLTDVEVRSYPLAERASHITGYIQKVNAEDLEKLEGQGYNAQSIIGRSGLEKIYEEKLRGIDGYEIVIVDENNQIKKEVAIKQPRHGEDIILTIDAQIQTQLYEAFEEDKSTSVALNPKTGEVLALVSTPSFDANDFVLGMSTEQWETLNNDPRNPLYNRFRTTLVPGSGFKSIIGAIGVSEGVIGPETNYGYSGRSWQKDASWGDYTVTTLKTYGDQVVLRNALIYSDNIYFAKAALDIGEAIMEESLRRVGFEEVLPFEIGLSPSQFSNTGKFESEIQLADSGYGQAQIMVNPIHVAAIYSAFVNEGNMIQPYLLYQNDKAPSYWKEGVFTPEAAEIIRQDLIEVVEQAGGGLAKVPGVILGGKTGTAEIKASKEDKDGTELGWFNVFTADKNEENPLLIISMVEDVKGRGGAGYVIPPIKEIFRNRK